MFPLGKDVPDRLVCNNCSFSASISLIALVESDGNTRFFSLGYIQMVFLKLKRSHFLLIANMPCSLNMNQRVSQQTESSPSDPEPVGAKMTVRRSAQFEQVSLYSSHCSF